MTNHNSNGHKLPVDGTLDLHLFSPKEIKQLIPDYIEACLEKNITQLRIVHGKGKGVLRQIVHSELKKHPAVISFRHESAGGSWGATVVDLIRK